MKRNDDLLPPKLKESLGVTLFVAVIVLCALVATWGLGEAIDAVGYGLNWLADLVLHPILEGLFRLFR